MKPNQVQRKAGKNGESTQAGKARKMESAKPQTAPAAMPVLIQPAQAVAEMVEALAAYRVRVNEAGSLALLLAARIRTGVKDFAEWSDFDRHIGFADGVRELALSALARLRSQADAYGIAHAGMVDALRGLAAPVPPAPGNVEFKRVHGFDFGGNDSHQFEQSNAAMLDLLEMMGDTLAERNGDERGSAIADALGEELTGAYDRVWKSAYALREAALAVEWHRLGEQRAAA